MNQSIFGPIMGAAVNGALGQMPTWPQGRTERIPTRPPMAEGAPMSTVNQAPPMMQGLGSRSQGIFQNYMKGIFNNPYMPPSIPGIYGQTQGGYGGFMPPNMGVFSPNPAQQPDQQPINNTVTTVGSPAYGMIDAGNGNYTDPRSGTQYRWLDLMNPGA